ncbi:hypothetical protein DMA15_35275 [Streptomyces sp. WAC 01529]|uniref:MFS transporter n=1 Tax=Streptomyces sp. WAC 01529 TaxID=2203205 RepID=UPI000F711C70|nr:MFS transporter [Streptomyces sp. WAC 01529]AZM57172.1 hypothetical protein DMA15_35275 [Streptomyces sp. WAC 01529]
MQQRHAKRLIRQLRGLLPDAGAARRLCLLTAVQSAGSGVFLSSSVIFFSRYAGLSPTQVGLGLAVAGGVGFLATVPAGRLADRFRPRSLLALGYSALVPLFISYGFVRTFPAFIAAASLISVCETTGSPLRATLMHQLFREEGAVRVRAQMRSFFNVGYMLGAAVASIALTVGTSRAFYAVLLLNALAQACCVYIVLSVRVPAAAPRAAPPRKGMRGALSNVPFLALTAVNGILELHYTIFTVGVPLWIVTHAHVPAGLNSVVIALDTVLVILLQVPLSRGTGTLAEGANQMRRGAWFMAIACAVYALSQSSSEVVAICFLLVGTVILVFGEIFQSAGSWTISFKLPPAGKQGEYQGVYALGRGVREFAGPALLTALIVPLAWCGWIVLMAIFLALSTLVGPLAEMAERHASRAVVEPTPSR